MTSTLKTALQESLQQEDAALKARLDPTTADSPPTKPTRKPRTPKAAPAAPDAAVKAKPAVTRKPRAAAPKAVRKVASEAPEVAAKAIPAAPTPAKPQKVTRESFSLPEGEAALIRALRTTVAKEGRIATKSELIRAGIQLAASLPTTELMARLDTLPLVVKKKKKK
ncbi:MAG: hypothetical protein JNJ44_05615 [Zoogloeaceae bacterium]|nr:hypothetical protein [Zoogloeaceae bacterium]